MLTLDDLRKLLHLLISVLDWFKVHLNTPEMFFFKHLRVDISRLPLSPFHGINFKLKKKEFLPAAYYDRYELEFTCMQRKPKHCVWYGNLICKYDGAKINTHTIFWRFCVWKLPSNKFNWPSGKTIDSLSLMFILVFTGQNYL